MKKKKREREVRLQHCSSSGRESVTRSSKGLRGAARERAEKQAQNETGSFVEDGGCGSGVGQVVDTGAEGLHV